MGVRSVLGRLRPNGGQHVVVECRHCGTTVAPDATECPSCNRSSLARYEFR